MHLCCFLVTHTFGAFLFLWLLHFAPVVLFVILQERLAIGRDGQVLQFVFLFCALPQERSIDPVSRVDISPL